VVEVAKNDIFGTSLTRGVFSSSRRVKVGNKIFDINGNATRNS